MCVFEGFASRRLGRVRIVFGRGAFNRQTATFLKTHEERNEKRLSGVGGKGVTAAALKNLTLKDAMCTKSERVVYLFIYRHVYVYIYISLYSFMYFHL